MDTQALMLIAQYAYPAAGVLAVLTAVIWIGAAYSLRRSQRPLRVTIDWDTGGRHYGDTPQE